MGLILAISGEK